LREQKLLLYDLPPNRTQLGIVASIALTLLAAFACTIPFTLVQLPQMHSFIPIVDTGLLLGDVITATLLFAQASLLRSRALIALATGYLFTGFIIIPHALTFPGAFAPTGLLGAGLDTTIWLYFFWHAGLPLAVIVYGLTKNSETAFPLRPEAVRVAILGCIVGSATLAAALTLLATAGQHLLPWMMPNAIEWASDRVFYVACVLMGLLVTAIAMVLRRRRSVLDLWLMLALGAWTLELALVMMTSARYSLGWYSGRIAGLLSQVLVLLMLLYETNRLYARLALSIMSQRRERQSRLMTLDAVAASLSHQVKQPLTAIAANAEAGLLWLERLSVGAGELPAILRSIASDSHRAANVMVSIRALFGKQRTGRVALNINDLIRDTLPLLAEELKSQDVSVQLHLGDEVPPIVVDGLQIQQVLLNLFTNAIEAMSTVMDRPRVLCVRSASLNRDVLIGIQDSGVGIDPNQVERIFDAFYSNKPHGMGIGLPLARSILEAHGGTLRAVPRNPAGTTFEIYLPCEASGPELVQSPGDRIEDSNDA
jgi:signal transduction histidine kinase